MVGPERPQIVLFGSSIVQYSFTDRGWGATLADLYSRTADIILRGYAGWNSRFALKVLDQVFPKDAVIQPSLVIVYFGGNDSTHPHPSGHGPHVPLSEFIENMRKIGEHLLSLSDKTRVIFLTPPPMNEKQIEVVFGDVIRGRSNELCRPYAEELLNLCREINVKGIDIWTAIQQQDDWLNSCFTDGIHFTAKASEVVVKEILKVVREADWKPSLYWKSLPVEFPFYFDVPNSISLYDLELTRNNQFEPPHPGSLCDQELTRNEQQLEPQHPVSLSDHELTRNEQQLDPPHPVSLCDQELTRNEQQLDPPHPVSLCDHELTRNEQLEPPPPTARL